MIRNETGLFLVRRRGTRDLPGLGSPGVRAGQSKDPPATATAADHGQVATPAPNGLTTQRHRRAGRVVHEGVQRGRRRGGRRDLRRGRPRRRRAGRSGPRAAPPSKTIWPRRSRTIPSSTIAIKTTALRFLGPDTALEEGRTTITPAGGGPPEISRFTVVYIKHDGQWLQSAVRDEHAHDLTPHDHLKELEWLVGDWINESQDAVVHTTCKWTDDGNFLVREFTMKTAGPAGALAAPSGSAGTP